MYLEMAELRAFTVLASELHFRRASERLFMSQPALSRLIRRLEEQTGGPLFARTRRRVALTEAGRALLPRAEQLCRDSAEALNRVKEVTEGRAGILRVASGSHPPATSCPAPSCGFGEAIPTRSCTCAICPQPPRSRA